MESKFVTHPEQIAETIVTKAQASANKRYIVAIAGPPASGKSTLAEQLSLLINQQAGQPLSEVIPMDGFHYDNDWLDQHQLRPRKGAEQTFDSQGFVDKVKQLSLANKPVSIPLFDRDKDAVVPDARTIAPQQRILLIEGNYLLLNTKPWSTVHALYDYSILLNPGIGILEERLVQRWLQQGYDNEGARQRALSNDIPNAKFVLEHSGATDITLTQG
ncbi:MAG: Fructokinase (EC [uncultured Thiotrichaceae bacterium]|uniref:Fructokinase (EC) n=1 Tax=uncultured Thiotrichaceae bacterium TaxID=298394 RepID=A0A6S6SW49_9GAMM|nr:MAG: Fructokinase (EC [uncultured Thiotrichaceae bacterium]